MLKLVGIGALVVGIAVLIWLAVSFLGGGASAQPAAGDEGPTGQSSNAGRRRAAQPPDQDLPKKEVKATT